MREIATVLLSCVAGALIGQEANRRDPPHVRDLHSRQPLRLTRIYPLRPYRPLAGHSPPGQPAPYRFNGPAEPFTPDAMPSRTSRADLAPQENATGCRSNSWSWTASCD